MGMDACKVVSTRESPPALFGASYRSRTERLWSWEGLARLPRAARRNRWVFVGFLIDFPFAWLIFLFVGSCRQLNLFIKRPVFLPRRSFRHFKWLAGTKLEVTFLGRIRELAPFWHPWLATTFCILSDLWDMKCVKKYYIVLICIADSVFMKESIKHADASRLVSNGS